MKSKPKIIAVCVTCLKGMTRDDVVRVLVDPYNGTEFIYCRECCEDRDPAEDLTIWETVKEWIATKINELLRNSR